MLKRSAVVLAALAVFAAAPHLAAEPTSKGYAPTGGRKIYYEVHGIPRDGKAPLLLMHGGGSTIDTSFGEVIEEFAKTRQVVAFEQKGHGRSPDDDKPFTFEESAKDAAALLKHLKIKKADVLGYSNGGQVAVAMALKYPDLVRRVIIGSAMLNREGAIPGFWDGFEHATLDNMPEELRYEYTRRSPHPQKLQSFHDKCVERMKTFKGWSDDQIRSIKMPALVLAGDKDIVTMEHVLAVSRLLPQGRLCIVPADHMSMVRLWPVVNINSFLDAK